MVREAYANFDYARVVAVLSAFLNTDLSAFYFDIRKDALYCEPPSSVKRLGALEAIERIFRAVTIWLAPILVFTAEEAWAAREPNARSVHLELFPRIPAEWRDEALAGQWETIRARALGRDGRDRDRARGQGDRLVAGGASERLYRASPALAAALEGVDFAEVCITSDLTIETTGDAAGERVSAARHAGVAVVVERARAASNARAPGAISIPRPPIPNIPTSPRATRRRCANSPRAAG